MRNRKTVFIAVSMFILLANLQLSSLYGQPSKKGYLGMDYSKWMVFVPGNDNVAPFYISTKPVTNKEYILFLAWTAATNVNYPEELFSVLPGVDSSWNSEITNPFADSASFRYYLNHSKPFVAEYMFNSLYLNAAVIGVSWKQANKFCHWLSDRYNEYSLIKSKYLMEDPNQRDGNNFTTESFIFKQYEGVWRKESFDDLFKPGKSGFDYMNYHLRPSFHLATQYELINALKIYKLVDCFCQEPKGSEFLNPFFKIYLPEHRGYVYSDPSYWGEEVPSFYLETDFDFKIFDLPAKITEWCLDSYTDPGNQSVRDIYKSYGFDTIRFSDQNADQSPVYYPQKNYLGFMDMIITGEYKNGEMEIVKAPVSFGDALQSTTPYIFDHTTQTVVNRNGDTYTTFRFAVNAIRKPIKK